MNKEWKWLELDSSNGSWPESDKVKVLHVAINVSGYYSLPVRILTLIAQTDNDLSQRYDTRFVEFERTSELSKLSDIIIQWKPEIIAFSFNIWNRDESISVLRSVKESLPDIVALAGGQEVTNSVIDYLTEVPELDFIIEGEGEVPFRQFLTSWDPSSPKSISPDNVSGVRYRDGEKVAFSGAAELLPDLDDVPSSILAGLIDVNPKHRLGVMLEGSRGCPFKCSFCFEGGKKSKVRMASIERLKSEIEYMASRGAASFHIMDAILCNSQIERLQALKTVFDNVRKANPNTIVSCELYADQITGQIAEALPALSIIDLGLQTTNPETAKAINRPFFPEKFCNGLVPLRKTRSTFNIYLICGLPYETFSTYLKGIRFVLNENPTRIFLNELCLLNGTELRWRAEEFGYNYDSSPPYRVRSSQWMTEQDFRVAEILSKVVEKRHNYSLRAIHSKVPWLSNSAGENKGKKTIHLKSSCTHGCSGCENAHNEPLARKKLNPHEFQQITDMDIEISGGDGSIDGPVLIQLAGQLQLSSVARVKLTLPPTAFKDPAVVEQVVMKGYWDIKTFAHASSIVAGKSNEISQFLGNFNRSFGLTGHAVIMPNVEVVLLAEGATAQDYGKAIKQLVKTEVTVITIPEYVQDLDGDWVREISEAFEAGIDSGVWLKMPPKIAKEVFNAMNQGEEVLEQLDALDLISHAQNHAPCIKTQ